MGRKARRIELAHAFRQLDRELWENTQNSFYVEALNMLPADERALMVLYMAHDRNQAAVCEFLHCDHRLVAKHLTMAKIKILDNLTLIKARIGNDDEDIR